MPSAKKRRPAKKPGNGPWGDPAGPGTGMPASLDLDEFGQTVMDVFGNCPYLVGSALTHKHGWRDVDVRLILSDEEYVAWGLGDPTYPHSNRKWRGLVRAFCALGRKMTGLPVDFQIQQQSHANATNDGPRSALFRHDFTNEKSDA